MIVYKGFWRRIVLNRYSFALPTFRIIVPNRVMMNRPIVPEHQRISCPPHPTVQSRINLNVPIQHFEHRGAFLRSQFIDFFSEGLVHKKHRFP